MGLRLLPLTVFPVLQTSLFALSCGLVDSHLAWAVASIMASGVALNFTIHNDPLRMLFLHFPQRE